MDSRNLNVSGGRSRKPCGRSGGLIASACRSATPRASSLRSPRAGLQRTDEKRPDAARRAVLSVRIGATSRSRPADQEYVSAMTATSSEP